MVINDYNNVFYPVLSLNMQSLKFSFSEDTGGTTRNYSLKGMLSYYNFDSSEWEPFIEQTKVRIIVDTYKNQKNIMIRFLKNVNFNITDMMIKILIEMQKILTDRERNQK